MMVANAGTGLLDLQYKTILLFTVDTLLVLIA